MENAILFFIIFLVVAMVVYAYVDKFLKDDKDFQATLQRNKEAKEREAAEKEAKELAIKQKYGECSRAYNNIGISIQAFDESRTVLIDGNDFSYDEITECTITDKATFVPGNTITTYSTKTNGKSMVGRALVGAVIAGPIGAVIGGATAKQTITSESVTTPNTEKHKYYVTIGISRDGYQEIVYDTNYEDRAKDVKRFIDSIICSKLL